MYFQQTILSMKKPVPLWSVVFKSGSLKLVFFHWTKTDHLNIHIVLAAPPSSLSDSSSQPPSALGSHIYTCHFMLHDEKHTFSVTSHRVKIQYTATTLSFSQQNYISQQPWCMSEGGVLSSNRSTDHAPRADSETTPTPDRLTDHASCPAHHLLLQTELRDLELLDRLRRCCGPGPVGQFGRHGERCSG